MTTRAVRPGASAGGTLLLSLLLAACTGNADPSAGDPPAEPARAERPVPAPPSDPGSPTARFSPMSTGAGGDAVWLSAAGFPGGGEVDIGFGPPDSEYRVVASGRADADGTLHTSVPVPAWAERGRDYVWVVASRAERLRAVTGRFRAGAGAESQPEAGEVRVEGRITDEGVECLAMRAADETLYTLAGAPEGLKPGDRVVVTGRVAEMSTCMQGTTLAVRGVERAG